jgi:hypothetical protein
MWWLLFLAAIFGVFVIAVWRMSAGPSNEEPAIGNNLPQPSTATGQFGILPMLQGPELGTPESLVAGDPEREIRRLERHRHFEEHRRHAEEQRRDEE